MHDRKRQKIKLWAVCFALTLSLASYLTLQILESHRSGEAVPEHIMADEVEKGALPDVQLFKQLMHKTLEYMLTTPTIRQ